MFCLMVEFHLSAQPETLRRLPRTHTLLAVAGARLGERPPRPRSLFNTERPLLYFPSSIAEAELAILCGGAGGRGGFSLSLAPAAASGVRVRDRRR